MSLSDYFFLCPIASLIFMMFEIRINKGGKERDVVIKQHFPNFSAIRKKKIILFLLQRKIQDAEGGAKTNCLLTEDFFMKLHRFLWLGDP